MTIPHLRVGAAIFGLALLSVQISFVVTGDGPIYSQVALIAGFTSLATLPVLAVLAYRADNVGAAAALMAGTAAALIYTLPTTTGRMAMERERDAAALAAHRGQLRLLDEQIERARLVVELAVQREAKQCATGVGPICRQDRRILEQRERSLNTLLAKRDNLLANEPPGDVGTDILAWATGISADSLRKIVAISAALGLDLSLSALFGFAAHAKSEPSEESSEPSKKRSEPSKPSVSLGERWLNGYIEENPDATAEQAYKAYKAELAGRGGKRMALSTFKRRFEKAAA